MTVHLTEHRNGFKHGFTAVTTTQDQQDPTGIAFAVLNLTKGQTHRDRPSGETAWMLMAGQATFLVGKTKQEISRSSLFDEGPSTLHVAAGTDIEISCDTDCEFTVYATANKAQFDSKIYYTSYYYKINNYTK